MAIGLDEKEGKNETKIFCYVDTFFESENLEFLIGCDRLRNGQYSQADSETFNALFSEKAQVRKEQSSIYSGAGGAFSYE